jgi:type II secretory ATPase GspE/PulE/Tfp pilus assembly ATPase PilB-like protein
VAYDWSPKGKLDDRETFILNLLGGLFHNARSLGADRIIITPLYLYSRDNIIFVIPEGFKNHRIATFTELWWEAIIARVKFDSGIDLNSQGATQEGEVHYHVSSFDIDNRVFVSIKTRWCNGYESARLLLAH